MHVPLSSGCRYPRLCRGWTSADCPRTTSASSPTETCRASFRSTPPRRARLHAHTAHTPTRRMSWIGFPSALRRFRWLSHLPPDVRALRLLFHSRSLCANVSPFPRFGSSGASSGEPLQPRPRPQRSSTRRRISQRRCACCVRPPITTYVYTAPAALFARVSSHHRPCCIASPLIHSLTHACACLPPPRTQVARFAPVPQQLAPSPSPFALASEQPPPAASPAALKPKPPAEAPQVRPS